MPDTFEPVTLTPEPLYGPSPLRDAYRAFYDGMLMHAALMHALPAHLVTGETVADEPIVVEASDA